MCVYIYVSSTQEFILTKALYGCGFVPPPTLYLFLLVLQAFLKFLLFFFKLFNLFSHNKVRIQFFKILQPSKVINTKQSKHFFVTNVVYLFI